MSVLAAHLTLYRLDTDAVHTTTAPGDLTVTQIDRVLDAATHLHLELPLGCAASLAIIAATGGPSMTDPLIPLFGELSLDGGATVDLRFVLVSAKRVLDPTTPTLVIDQYDQSTIYALGGADRVTYVKATGDIVFNAAPGTVPRPVGSIGRTALPAWPTTKGLFAIRPGASTWVGQDRLTMSAAVDSHISALTLSLDVNALSTQSVLKTVGQRLAGTFDPLDPAPLGARAHWVSHSGDAARNPIGVAQCIALGRVGDLTTPTLIFDGDGLDDAGHQTGTWDETTTIRFGGSGLALDPRLEELFAQIATIGGPSDHGLADGTGGGTATTIRCMVCINTDRAFTSTGWDDNLPIFGTTAGVYYHVPGSGFLVPMSPVWVINALVYDNAAGKLYAATPTGVFSADAAPPAFGSGVDAVWTRVGGLAAPVDECWLVPGGALLVRCGGSAKANGVGIDGVYLYPALDGDAGGDTQGYAGYSRIAHSGSPLAAGGTPDALYYVDANKPGTVYLLAPGSTTAPVPLTGLATGLSVVGIDTVITTLPDTSLSQVVFIRTDGAGSTGLYAVVVGDTAATSAAGGLTAPDGTPVAVRRVVSSGITVFEEFINAWACTDGGLFRTGAPLGGSWSAPNADSGLGDFDISMAAAGPAQTVLGHVLCRLWTGSNKAILSSADAGDSWTDILAAKLDKGPAWYARAQAWGATPWPDNTVGALGDLPTGIGDYLGGLGNLSPGGATDTGGTGTVLPSGTGGVLPLGFLRARRLNEQNQETFRTLFLGGPSPQQGMQWSELSEITASANVGVITAAEQLDLAEYRWLAAASIPRWQLPISGAITQDDAAGRDLAPTDAVRVRYHPAGWTAALALDLPALVVSHSITISGGVGKTQTTVSNTLENGSLDPNMLAAAQADRLSKAIRWG